MKLLQDTCIVSYFRCGGCMGGWVGGRLVGECMGGRLSKWVGGRVGGSNMIFLVVWRNWLLQLKGYRRASWLCAVDGRIESTIFRVCWLHLTSVVAILFLLFFVASSNVRILIDSVIRVLVQLISSYCGYRFIATLWIVAEWMFSRRHTNVSAPRSVQNNVSMMPTVKKWLIYLESFEWFGIW